MKRIIMVVLLMSITAVWAVYTVGATVAPADNLTWTISGPPGHYEVGKSSAIFNKIAAGKPVVIFAGQSW